MRKRSPAWLWGQHFILPPRGTTEMGGRGDRESRISQVLLVMGADPMTVKEIAVATCAPHRAVRKALRSLERRGMVVPSSRVVPWVAPDGSEGKRRVQCWALA